MASMIPGDSIYMCVIFTIVTGSYQLLSHNSYGILILSFFSVAEAVVLVCVMFCF